MSSETASAPEKASAKALRQSRAARKAASPAAEPPVLTVVAPAAPVVAGPVLKKKDLVDRACEKSGVKKKDVRPAVEATLDVLAEALLSGAELMLPPLGRVKVVRQKVLGNARILTIRVRVPSADPGGKTPLAAEED